MKLVIASSNAHKIEEIKDILGEKFTEIVSAKSQGFYQEIEENGLTFYDNALIKAAAVSDFLNCNALSDDSGLCVDALSGAPGVNSARYAGFHGDDMANNIKLISEMEGKTDRSCSFVSSVVLRFSDGKIVCGEGRTDGYLLESLDGQNGFGYDPLFFCTELNKSFGQATKQEKNLVSHRYKALMDLLSKL